MRLIDKKQNRGSVLLLDQHIEIAELQILSEKLLIGCEYPSSINSVVFVIDPLGGYTVHGNVKFQR